MEHSTNDSLHAEKPICRPALTETEVGLIWQLLSQLVSHCDEFTFNQEGAFTALLKKIALKHLGLFVLEGHTNGPYQILAWNSEKCTVAYDPPCRGRLDAVYSGLKPHIDGINPDIKMLGVKYSNPIPISPSSSPSLSRKENDSSPRPSPPQPLQQQVLIDLHVELKCIPLFGSKSFAKNVKPKELRADLEQVAAGRSDVAICVCSVGDFAKYLVGGEKEKEMDREREKPSKKQAEKDTNSESAADNSSSFFAGVRPIDIQEYFTVVARGPHTTSLARRVSSSGVERGHGGTSVIIAVVMRNSETQSLSASTSLVPKTDSPGQLSLQSDSNSSTNTTPAPSTTKSSVSISPNVTPKNSPGKGKRQPAGQGT
jgi:hypothetical protein